MNANKHGRRRGIAMILVLGLIAIASVLSWAMLSTATVRARVETTVADAVDAGYQADSGASFALYYLAHPELTKNVFTYSFPHDGHFHTNNEVNASDMLEAHTASRTGLAMWSGARGTTDVSYATPGDGTFSIRSTTTLAGLTRTTLVDAAYAYNTYQVTHAAAFNGDFTVPLNMTINGPVVCKGTVSDPLGRISNSPAIVAASTEVTPKRDDLALADELDKSAVNAAGERAYTIEGVTYWAEPAPATITGTLVSTHPLTNPKNVWFSKNDTAINNATINGTLVVIGDKKLTVTGVNTITAYAEMPAALVGGALDMRSTAVPSRLTANGVLWVGKEITDGASIRSALGYLRINGALLMGDGAPKVNSRYASSLEVTYDASVSKIPALSKVKTLNGLTVRRWRTESN